MDWLRIIGFIIPVIALFISFNARLKKLNNERISVYKDIKSLSSKLKLESYEIKVIDDELKQLIVREVTGIFETTPARKLMKLLSYNPNLEAFKKKRLKALIRCIDETNLLKREEVCEIKFKLNRDLYNKRAQEGTIYILAFLIGYITFLISGFSSIVGKDYLWAGIQITMSFSLLISMMFTKASYPAPWNYKKHETFIDELNSYKIV
ncbi:TPA: hypothetical protein ACH27Q_004864 [Raoultella ornithinolytica]